MSLLDILGMLRAPFSGEARSQWIYEEPGCPCCRAGSLDAKGTARSRAVSMNAYLYRERSLLIIYPLCARCGPRVLNERENGPLHRAIETNLIAAYNRFIVAGES